MALVELEKFKRALRIEDTAQDTRLSEALEDASDAVRNDAGRDFGSDTVTEDRTYDYDGAGVLNIDDAAAVNSVRYATSSQALSTAVWMAMAETPPSIYTYLILPEAVGSLGISPEMGFNYNLDRFRPRTGYAKVVVNAAYGWPAVPGAVQRATMFTAAAMLAFPPVGGASGGAALASESIADLARSYVVEQGLSQAHEGVPERARSLLDPFRRHSL